MTSQGRLPLAGLTVLIVEDEFLIAVDAQQIIEEAGAAHALLANSVGAARELLATEHPIDVCLLDLKLGKEDGLQLVSDLASRRIPYVVATGYADLAGEHVLVHKPYNGAEVITALLVATKRRQCS